jgi:cytoskeletal protein CcmA (bactofilin family)
MSLWQKPENERPTTTTNETTSSSAPAVTHQERRPSSGTPATIGQSVQIDGELTGQEDLIIDGKIEGKVVLEGYHLTVGPNGRISAEVRAKSVLVNGEVAGNIVADDKVEISPTGSVLGDITAPRVALADGSSFKGSIDMSNKASRESHPTPSSVSVNRDVAIGAGASKN